MDIENDKNNGRWGNTIQEAIVGEKYEGQDEKVGWLHSKKREPTPGAIANYGTIEKTMIMETSRKWTVAQANRGGSQN